MKFPMSLTYTTTAAIRITGSRYAVIPKSPFCMELSQAPAAPKSPKLLRKKNMPRKAATMIATSLLSFFFFFSIVLLSGFLFLPEAVFFEELLFF